MERFTKTGKEEDGPDLNTFLLDFDGNTMHTSWNERIVLLLANQYLEEEDPFTDDLPKVRHAFMQHLRTLHRNYQKRRAIQTDDDVIQEQQDQRRDNQSARQRKVNLPYRYQATLKDIPRSANAVKRLQFIMLTLTLR